MMTIGFFYITFVLFYSIGPLFQWIEKLNAPGWLEIILQIGALLIWFSGIAFMFYAEKAVLTKKKYD